ncbi:glycosyltransferase [Coriobacteriaceae bacterium]|nr:glycosyltransferase [Coriobacteriaceae bacterium]
MEKSRSVLLHWPQNKIKPTGGPAGYLYNLRKGLESLGESGYAFLPPAGSGISGQAWLGSVVPTRLNDLRRLRSFVALPDKHLEAPVDYNSYEFVHFHSTEDLYLHRRSLSRYQGTVLLTSHSPCVSHKELLSRLNPRDVERHIQQLSRLEEIDTFAFKRADYVIFPCAEAEEPYFHTWPAYEGIRDERKIRYLPTGAEGGSVKESRQAVRVHYGIPDDAFVISYVGRHNEIKGYGDLLTYAPDILERHENVWFLVAGKEGPLRGLSHPRWVEAGWTDDPHSIIAAADTFVLPNRETFFDLVLLEVLSLGQNVIATNTGGNKYFLQFNAPGIQIVDDLSQLDEKVSASMNAPLQERVAWGIENEALFMSNFTCEVFARRYAEVINGLS